MKHFKVMCLDFKDYIDTSIYGSHLFRLPNQNCVGKTRHEVYLGELKDFILIAENVRDIDDIKTKGELLCEYGNKKEIPIEDEDDIEDCDVPKTTVREEEHIEPDLVSEVFIEVKEPEEIDVPIEEEVPKVELSKEELKKQKGKI